MNLQINAILQCILNAIEVEDEYKVHIYSNEMINCKSHRLLCCNSKSMIFTREYLLFRGTKE